MEETMNGTARGGQPRLPSEEELRQRPIVFLFDELADELIVSFYDPPRPAVSVFRDEPDWLALRVDPETDEVVAVQIVDFLTEALRERPELLVLAKLAGIPRETIERSRVPREEYGRAAVRLLRSLAVPA